MNKSEIKLVIAIASFFILYTLIVLFTAINTNDQVGNVYYVITNKIFLIAVLLIILFFYFLLKALLDFSKTGKLQKKLSLIVATFSCLIIAIIGYSLFRGFNLYAAAQIQPKAYTVFLIKTFPLVMLIALHVFRLMQMQKTNTIPR